MIYRKKYLDLKFLKFNNFNKNLLLKKLIKSFKKNYKQNYKKRLSFFTQEFYTTHNKQFYISQSKLYCPIMYSSKVPSSKTLVSRFFLVKNSDRNLFGGYQK